MNTNENLKWIKGLRAGYAMLKSKQPELYSWFAVTSDSYVFTVEVDHRDPANNRYDHNAGTFRKFVPGISVDTGAHANSVRHAKELFEAASDALHRSLKCRLLLLQRTRFSEKPGNILSATDGTFWIVTTVSGSVTNGFGFTLERVKVGI